MPDPHEILRRMGVAASAVRPVEGGADTLIWRVETPQGARALRVFRPEQAPVAEREARVMSLLAGAGLPVPAVWAQATVRRRPALLIGWMSGQPLAHVLRADPTQVGALGRRFGQAHARLHALALPADLLAWLRAADLASALPGASPGRPALLHLDFHPMNLLVEGGRISGVIDWANLRPGDPRLDVARTLAILSVDPSVWHLPAAERAVVRALRRAYLCGYTEAGGDLNGLAAFLPAAADLMWRDLARRHAAADLARIQRWARGWRSTARTRTR